MSGKERDKIKHAGIRNLQVVRILGIAFLSLIVFGCSCYFFHRPLIPSFKEAQLEREIKKLAQLIQTDCERKYNIQKIVAIINRFNNEMALSLKQEIAQEINEMTLKYPNLDIELICATITHETGRTWNPQVVSRAGAMGLMQIMPATGKLLAAKESMAWTSAREMLCNPIYNIRLGCRYLSWLLNSLNDTEGALAAYNGGMQRAAWWMRQDKSRDILWNETRNYIPSVLKLVEEYREMNL